MRVAILQSAKDDLRDGFLFADFLIPSIMTSRTVKRASMAYWTTAAIQIGYITTSKSRKAYTDGVLARR